MGGRRRIFVRTPRQRACHHAEEEIIILDQDGSGRALYPVRRCKKCGLYRHAPERIAKAVVQTQEV